MHTIATKTIRQCRIVIAVMQIGHKRSKKVTHQHMKHLSIIILFLLIATDISAKIGLDRVVYSTEDSIKVERLLAEAREEKPENAVLFFANKFIDVPYVAKTLDRNPEKESLVVNLQEMDCTTFVETSVALARTYYAEKTSFADYANELSMLRYEHGAVAYEHRNHYFTGWIMENTARGAVEERDFGSLDFAANQTIGVNFMSTNPQYYPQLKANSNLIEGIKKMERRISGGRYKYIPKGQLRRSKQLRSIIADGDILVLTTKKHGLDCSHIGFAVWKNDGLHLLNASQIHGRVILEPMTLYTYMQKHPSQMGIRAVEVKR